MSLLIRLQGWLDSTRIADFLGPLALRLYLVPVFWVAGTNKLAGMDNVINWFGNTDWGLGLPFPAVMAWLAVGAEVLGAVALLIGFGTRWFSIPLMVTMLVAAFSVHAKNGWQAVADPRSPFANANIEGAMERLDKAKELLREHGNYDWLTETGNFVISNSGVEWAVTYFVMLLALFFSGAGKLSIDHLIAGRFRSKTV
ncbi:MAG: DoxX family protein [Gammaproteobacteria bacterium]|nr:DoxX family protein [Gammaproteobacteria bacterium]MDH4314527.1 DoxX family protein [Gammaproteobacteria bacterium]MDH5214589.1 DoxX family protein [Gammaproteobacteria bacterium]MDH5500104.1 DoxX family protein [Gammaproteobacteria bacterium]